MAAPFRQFRRDLIARRHEILQGFAGGRVGSLVGEFPSAIEESGGRGGRESQPFIRGTFRQRFSRDGDCHGPLGDDSLRYPAARRHDPGEYRRIVASAAPLTSDLSASYASNGLIVVTLALALAVWSFRHALGGRK